MMQDAHQYLKKIKGQTSYKLMGSGAGLGFNPLPDWSVYSLLQTWTSEKDAVHFFESSELIELYKIHTIETCTLYMKTILTKGVWNGENPFISSEKVDTQNIPIAVLTRATIKPSLLFHFWSSVPSSQKQLQTYEGLLFSKGVAEIPIFQIATFSLWENEEVMKSFAYSHNGHKSAIKKTRTLKWYKEEMFTRFYPFKVEGTWEGKQILTT
ncbi:spheroidene monooxygenase [Sediminitomix flava]|uniref:Spheroidene monooxygenase n=2 Tax=Sediminitomix flava TaxID=379075 RepID=A0A315Z7W5_SEDFL|nr:spheroidene monooxygenase [Sediminitomix flava]